MPNKKNRRIKEVVWKTCSFSELTTTDLYEVLKLRQEVFIVEQNCPYLDMDDFDQESLHLLGMLNNELIVYARILPPKLYYKEPSIGRIVNRKTKRAQGFGKLIMNKAIQVVEEKHGNQAIRIMAQCYLISFYQLFGFKEDGEEFLEDGIPHIEMVKL